MPVAVQKNAVLPAIATQKKAGNASYPEDEEELEFRTREDDIPMRLIRADSPIMGQANRALDKGRTGEKQVYNQPSRRTTGTKGAKAETNVRGQRPKQIQAVRSISHAYNCANPLASSSKTHPVIRMHGDEESEQMEPSIFKTPRFGDAPFLGADEDAMPIGSPVVVVEGTSPPSLFTNSCEGWIFSWLAINSICWDRTTSAGYEGGCCWWVLDPPLALPSSRERDAALAAAAPAFPLCPLPVPVPEPKLKVSCLSHVCLGCPITCNCRRLPSMESGLLRAHQKVLAHTFSMSRSMRSKQQPASSDLSTKNVVYEELGSGVDVNYNPEFINSALRDLEMQMKSKCNQIQKDADFMCTSIKQAFHLELIKLPNQVKGMSMSRFRSEFGDSLEAVTRGTVNGKAKSSAPSSSSSRSVENSNNNNIRSSGSTGVAMRKSSTSRESGSNVGSAHNAIFQTPSGGRSKSHTAGLTPGTAARKRTAKEGELLLSSNGSPLGEWDSTAVKPKGQGSRVPSTPSVQVPLGNGDVVDIDDADIAGMTADVKQDALVKMQAMMANMQSLMDKLQK